MNQSLNSLWRVMQPPLLGGPEMPDAETTAAYKLAVADPVVQRRIAACVNELAQLVKEAGAEHFAAAAVQGAATLDATTPAQWLETQLNMLRTEIELTRKERSVATERRRAENAAAQPLIDAVSRVAQDAASQREALLRRLDALRRHESSQSRWTQLRAAGLTEEEIARLALKPEEQDPEQQAVLLRRRIPELDAQLAKCRAYAEDPLHDPEHVRGLGFDGLVDAQLALRATAA